MLIFFGCYGRLFLQFIVKSMSQAGSPAFRLVYPNFQFAPPNPPALAGGCLALGVTYIMFHKPVESFPSCGNYRKFKWGGNHTGDDYPCTVGSYVCAVKDGIVVLSQELNGFGSLDPSSKGGCVIIKHQYLRNASSNKDFFAIYGHLNRWVEVGSTVRKGQVIGVIRKFTNGGISCPHLHFGIYTGVIMPSTSLGYNKDLSWYQDPGLWLATYATDSDTCQNPNRADWNPILSCFQ